MAAAEKLAVLDTQDYFRSRVERADLQVFDRIMARAGGQPHARATSASLGATVFAVPASDKVGLGIAMFLIAFYAYKTPVKSCLNSALQGLEPVDHGAGGADTATAKSQTIYSWLADQ